MKEKRVQNCSFQIENQKKNRKRMGDHCTLLNKNKRKIKKSEKKSTGPLFLR